MRRFRLKGSSGVSISFKKVGNFKTVIKKSTKSEQIDRLRIQCNKQIFLSKKKNNLFNIPPIIDSGLIGNDFFYEYEFIEGISLSEALRNKPLKHLMGILDKLVLIVEDFSRNNNFFEVSYNQTFKDALHDKIVSVSRTVGLERGLEEVLLKRLELLDLPLQKTMYHGDLSLDNIIIDKKNNIWLIDSIGTFYPHYWMDLSKLFQDTEGGWHKLKHGNVLDELKCQKLTCFIKERVKNFDCDYLKNHNFLMAVIFLRILPYLNSKLMRGKILKRINNYLGSKVGIY